MSGRTGAQGNTRQLLEAGETRRGFLTKAGLGVAALVPGLGLLSQAAQADAPDMGRNNERAFRAIRQHERDHVAFLEDVLGSSARPKPTFKNLRIKRYKDFVIVARALENVGARAYLGAASHVQDPEILAAVLTIAMVEARHAGFVNVLLEKGITVANASFEEPLTPDEVMASISPFIADLNGGTVPGYSTTFSDANDVDILNFALALEYLEAEFYEINGKRHY